MVKVTLPFGSRTLEIEIPSRNLAGVLRPKELPGVSDPKEEVKKALENPINSDRLTNIVKPGDRIAIVIDDITRPLPSRHILPPILSELKNVGVRKEDITIIIGTGTHRPNTAEEAKILLGDYIATHYRWINHDCDAEDLVYVGKTRYGNRVYINREYMEADVKILVGDVMLHYYAGYGGGPKSIIPGIAGRETIEFNHSMMFHPKAISGVSKGNPVFEDIMEGAKLAGADFVVNVVLNTKKEIVKAYSGGLETVFYKCVELIDDIYKVKLEKKADIVLASAGGFPFDINFYQAHKGLFNAEFAAKENGRIIYLAECRDGIGHKLFEEWMLKYNTPEDVMRKLQEKFVIGGHKAYYMLRSISRFSISLHSNMSNEYVMEVLKITPISNINEIIKKEISENSSAKVLVMPFANETLPVITG